MKEYNYIYNQYLTLSDNSLHHFVDKIFYRLNKKNKTYALFHLATLFNDRQTLNRLARLGCNVNIVYNYQYSALDIAIQMNSNITDYDRCSLIRLLLQLGVTPTEDTFQILKNNILNLNVACYNEIGDYLYDSLSSEQNY